MEGEGVREEGGRGSHGGVGSKSLLTWACHRPCLLMCAGHRLQAVISCMIVFVCVHSFPFVGMCHCPWVFISVCGHVSSSVGICGHLFSFIGSQLCLWVCISVSWCTIGRFLMAVGDVVMWWLVVCNLLLWVM